MSLKGRRIWLATRGGERARAYQADLVAALEAVEVAAVEVVGVEAILRSAAVDLTTRAGEWLETTAGRLAKGLRIDRLIGRDADSAETSDKDAPEQASLGPDLVVLDDPRLVRALRVSPELREAQPVMVGLLDDFAVDTRWRDAAIDALVVPALELEAVHRSPARPTVVAGPPVASLFGESSETAEARAKLGLDAQRPTVVVAAHRLDPDTLDRSVFQLTLLEPVPAVLFDHADSPERAQLLREAARDYGLEAHMFGRVEGLATTYAAADLILSAADDPSVPDMLRCRRPMVLVGPDRGTARARFLADQGAVRWVEDVVELGTHLETLLASPATGQTLVDRAAAAVPSEANQILVGALGKLLDEVEARRAEAVSPEEPAATPPTEPEPSPVRAPFEAIGAPVSEARKRPVETTPLTAAQAKDQMAALILKEREAERGLSEAVRSRDRWLDRLELAKTYDDPELTAIAAERLEQARVQVARLNGQIELLRRSKAKLKARVERSRQGRPIAGEGGLRPPGEPPAGVGSDVEGRFRKMEIERDLDRLRGKLDDEGTAG